MPGGWRRDAVIMADNPGQPDLTASTSLPAPVASPGSTPAAPQSDAGVSQPTQPNEPAPNATPAVDFERVDGDAYRALRDEILAQPPPEPGVTPAEAAPAATEGQTPAETTPPANETKTDEPPAPEGDDDLGAKIPNRIRLGALPEKERALTSAAVLLAGAEGISVIDAMARIAGKPAATEATPPPAPTPAPVIPDPEGIRTQIAELKKQRNEAASEADTVKMMELSDQIEEAKDNLAASLAAGQQAQRAFARSVQSSKEQAHVLYPTLKDEASPLFKKWNEVYSRLEASNDPLLDGNNPAAPLRITQMAAAELGLPPVDPKAPKAAAQQAAPSTPPNPSTPARSVQLAPGSAKSAEPANAAGQLAARVDSITKMDDYEALKEELFRERVA